MSKRNRTLVLGGGMGGLAAAAHLSEAGRDVAVLQRGWRLGGKAASHRGPHGRIEEHGLHVWLGYYDNAFRFIRRAYEELDRTRADPNCPVLDWEDAFTPSADIGVFDRHDGIWSPWLAHFSHNDRVPGSADASPSLAELARRAATLLANLITSIAPEATSSRNPASRVTLSASPIPPRVGAARSRADELSELGAMIRRLEIGTMVGMVQVLNAVSRVPAEVGSSPLRTLFTEQLTQVRSELRNRTLRDRDSRRLWEAIDLVTTSLIGIYADRLLQADRGFEAVNHLDFREWLAGHGADPVTLESGLVRGMYDLVFAYRNGDHTQPAFEAGTGLQLAGRFFFDYKGALFWKMNAGMGEIVVAPAFQWLRSRGVEFKFFHRLLNLRLDDAGRRVDAVEVAEQARLAPGVDSYDPLVRTRGLPCFAAGPLLDQLDHSSVSDDLESHFGSRDTERRVLLRRGEDFDDLVLAVSLGIVPEVARELLAADPRWRAMVDNVATVATQAFQIWTAQDEADLGWPRPGSTVSGYEAPFDTYSSMPHLVGREDWGAQPPSSVAYFCSALADSEADPEVASDRVRANAVHFLEQSGSEIWPLARKPDRSFDWCRLHGASHGDSRDLDAHYWVANVDPSDRYVQSLPGTGRYRIAADESGFENLSLAGDWIDTGLNAGCIEAAVISGIQAANALLGRDIDHEVLGGWTPSRARPHTVESSAARRDE